MENPRTFEWSNFDCWGLIAAGCLSPTTRKLLSSASPDTYQHPDWPQALEALFGTEAQYESLVGEFSEQFFSTMRAVRVFHCTRTRSVESLRASGIRAIDLEQRLHGLFVLLREHLPSLTYADVLEAARKTLPIDGLRENAVYVGVDVRFLMDHCGHYLLYGSEGVLAVVRHLENSLGQELAHHLKEEGTPTVVEIDLPVGALERSDQQGLAREALYTYAYNTFYRTREVRALDYGLRLHGRVPPEWIFGFQHPTEIRDPFSGSSRV